MEMRWTGRGWPAGLFNSSGLEASHSMSKHLLSNLQNGTTLPSQVEDLGLSVSLWKAVTLHDSVSYRHQIVLPSLVSLAAAKLLQSCPILCDPIDSSPPDSPVPGILQARTLEWVAISFSNAWKWKVKVKSPSRVQLSVTPWTAAHQAPLSMGFSRQEYWSGVPLVSLRSI